jgi:predicted HicB family RNase H-like nuclease
MSRPPPKLGLERPTTARAAISKAAAEIEEGPEVQIHVRMTKRVHRAMKMRALQEGVSIRDFILGLLAEKGIK